MAHAFSQRRWGYRLGFELGDEHFRYMVRDGGSERSYTVAYERFDMADPVLERVPASKPWIVLYMLTSMGVVLTLALDRAPFAVLLVPIGLAALGGLGLFLWRTTGAFAVPFTVFVDDHGGEAFRVMRDGQHDTIIGAIAALRRERLRRLWGALDLEEDLGAERARFDWLLVNGIVDADEHADAVRRLYAASDGSRPGPNIQLH